MSKQYVVRDSKSGHNLAAVSYGNGIIYGVTFHDSLQEAITYEEQRKAFLIANDIMKEFDYTLDVVEIDSPSNSAIKPSHYRKGDIDLYESWYLTRPFNEVRAILESIAERYIKRDKNDRVEDISKAIETLERLKEYEVRERENE